MNTEGPGRPVHKPAKLATEKLVRKEPSLRKLLYLIMVFHLGVFAYWSVSGFLMPLANWDMVGYTGAAMLDTPHDGSLRTAALADIKMMLPAERFQQLNTSTPFAYAVASDDAAFNAQLPFYNIKPLYVVLTRWVGKIIGSFSRATVVVSAIAFFLIGVATWRLRPASSNPIIWTALVLALTALGSPSFTLLAAASTPDTLAGSLILLGCISLQSPSKSAMTAIFWSLSVLARPDSVLTVCAFFPLLLLTNDDNRALIRRVVLVIVSPIITYLAVSAVIPHYPWTLLIAHTFLGPFPNPAVAIDIDIKTIYQQKLWENVVWLSGHWRALFFAIAGLSLVFLKQAWARGIGIASVINMTAKILIFPYVADGGQERFYFVFYYLIAAAWIQWHVDSTTSRLPLIWRVRSPNGNA